MPPRAAGPVTAPIALSMALAALVALVSLSALVTPARPR